MGTSKAKLFSKRQNNFAIKAKALAHPARIAIIEQILKADSCICSDFVYHLPLTQPTISQHLSELRKADIITGTIKGNRTCYCLNLEALEAIREQISNWEKKLNPSRKKK